MIEVSKVPVKFKMSVMQVGNSLRITIPQQLAEHLKIQKGDTVALWSDNSHVVMEKEEA